MEQINAEKIADFGGKIAPLCPYFGKCGGCTAQHIPYSLTLENKKKFIADQLRRLNITTPENITIKHADEYHYRNRMDFVFFEGGLGLREKDQFNKIIPIERCEIANEKVNALLLEVNAWFKKSDVESFNLRTKQGVLKYALIRASEYNDDSCISFALNSASGHLAYHIDQIKEFTKTTTAKNVVISRVEQNHDDSISDDCFAVKGTETLTENFLGKKIEFHSQGFFQNNPKTAMLMVEHAKSILSKYEPEKKNLLDLYGGVGTFGLVLAENFRNTFIVESFPQSIESAKKNIQANEIKNAQAHCLDSQRMNKVVAKGNLLAITDPPRSGMTRQAIENLIALEPEVIIYVSCNPAQFAKEMLVFGKKYEMRSLTCFDMFPQTTHLETMAELVRKQ
jgi:23S rRNA (uracil1939-C5)-methyltransferase